MVVGAAVFAFAGGAAAALSLIEVRLAGLISVLAAALSGMTLTLDSVKKSIDHQSSSASHNNLAWMISAFCQRVEGGLAMDQAQAEWRLLELRREQVFGAAPSIAMDDRAYRRAEALRQRQQRFEAITLE